MRASFNICFGFATLISAGAQEIREFAVDSLLDKLIDRVLSAPQLDNADLEDATLGKPGQVAMPTGNMQSVAAPSRANFPPGYHQCLQQYRAATSIGARANPSSRPVRTAALGKDEPVVVIGVAADSGCGKSTFMRRLTNVFGGEQVGPLGGGFGNGGWETNTLVSDQTTVICLDDYHLNDRGGRKVSGRTALHTEEQKFDLMAEQIAALKRGETVQKPIYNHVNGTLDAPETIKPTPILIIEGLHPFVDERVRELLDFSIYLDITDDVKFAWKIARDMEERGHSLESIKASIEARKPDFDAYVAPQRANSDLVIQVLPTELANDETGKILKVRFIQGKKDNFDPAYLFDEGSTISWIPCGSKLSCDFPGMQLKYGPDTWFGKEVNVLEMDGQFNKVEELCYIESHLQNLDTKFYGEATQAMIKNKNSPGSNNGSGFFQTLAAFKLRSLYEKISGKKVETPAM
eukprot:gnl/MRDRNA2_/MRDRNA2_30203_c0_seq1.p1 gnl/MRDRNA2_/MRDRNA2_30203_c0~~gnl/MRDRNA2_/MRDRNA2_30203_c0_seq1.p1  ORF type:complete len:463 (+),score=111.27 gnl/MRDRNA2_/MRDRNA2_30203_c0_seq1:72-1460(+)